MVIYEILLTSETTFNNYIIIRAVNVTVTKSINEY